MFIEMFNLALVLARTVFMFIMNIELQPGLKLWHIYLFLFVVLLVFNFLRSISGFDAFIVGQRFKETYNRNMSRFQYRPRHASTSINGYTPRHGKDGN